MLGSIWAFRGFVFSSIRREFQARYRNSLLGALWTVLNPLAMILVYTLVFSRIMHTRLPGVHDPFAYSVFLCAGLLPWQWFTELLGRNVSVFVDHAGLIRKSTFPYLALPVIAFLSSAVNFLLIAFLFLLFLIISGNWPGVGLLWVIPLLILQSIFAGSDLFPWGLS